jgi:hypothetical protein
MKMVESRDTRWKMRTLLEKTHDVSSIGTFVLTIVVVAFMVIPMFPHASQGAAPRISWLMPSVLAFSLLFAGFLHLMAARTSQSRRTLVEDHSLQMATANVLGDVVAPIKPTSISAQRESPESFPATVQLSTLKIPVGEFQNVGEVKIEVREVRKAGEANYGAVLYVNTGGGLVFGGEKVTKISTNCYYLPLEPIENLKEPYSIYFHHFRDRFLSSPAIYLEHINPHSGVVTIKVCKVRS